jgi:cellulose biosynthesis protein BcsQ
LIIKDSFTRSKEFEITQVLKGLDQDHAYVVTSSPKQHSKILRSSLAVKGELITPTPIREKLSATEITRKNCLVIIAKNFNKGLMPEQIVDSKP